MSKFLNRAIRSVVPYRLLAAGRMAQLKFANDPQYDERADRRVFFNRAFALLRKNNIEGDYAEFGCNGGMTFVLAYQHIQKYSHSKIQRKMWAFDSFRGLPAPKSVKDEHPAWIQGEMLTGQDEFVQILTRSEVPRSCYELVPGFYEDTIGKNARAQPAKLPDSIALAYIDCDLYSSTTSVLEFLSTRLKHGMVLALDDYYSLSSSAAAGERIALIEFFRSIGDKFVVLPYVQYGYAGMSFVLEDRKFTGYDPMILLSH